MTYVVAAGVAAGAAHGNRPVAHPAPAEPVLPPGTIWVWRAPGADGATVDWITGTGTVRHTSHLRLNAVGCGSDHSLYGLSSGSSDERFPDGPHLIRLTVTGHHSDLGPVTTSDNRYALSAAYAGTGIGRALVVRAGGMRYDIDVTKVPPAASPGTVLPELPFTGDWTADPRTGDLLAVSARQDRTVLIRLPASGGPPVVTPWDALPARSGYGAVTATDDGVLYTMENDNNGRSEIYRVPIDDPGQATLIWSGDPVESSDAAACPPLPTPTTPVTRPVLPPPAQPPTRTVRPAPAPSPTDRAPIEPEVPASSAPATTRVPAPTPRLRPSGPVAAPSEPAGLVERFLPFSTVAVLAALAARLTSRSSHRARAGGGQRPRP